jgi:hypothetical protein
MHTYISIYLRTHAYTFIHTHKYLHTLIRTYISIYLSTHTHTYICTYKHTYIETHIIEVSQPGAKPGSDQSDDITSYLKVFRLEILHLFKENIAPC